MSQINLNLFTQSYGTLAGFSQTIHDGFVAQVASYPSPSPTMLIFQGDIDDFNAAIAKWGVKGNRGSHNDHLALIAQRTVIREDLRLLALDAMKTKPNNPDSWALLGFKIRKDKTKPQPLKMVQNLRQLISSAVPSPYIKLRWKKPLDTGKGDVKGYIVQRSNTSLYPVSPDGRALANIVGIIPNTAFLDTNPYVGENYYWVTPFNATGNGVTSAGLLIVSTKSK